MRAIFVGIGLLLSFTASFAAEPTQVHEFAPADLAKGNLSGLKFQRVENYDVARFEGRATVSGTFVAEWTINEDEAAAQGDKSYTFEVDRQVAESLPHWRDYFTNVIYIDNGKRALEMFAGRDIARRFELHQLNKVSVTGRLVLTRLRVWVECDSANARAVAAAALDAGKPLVDTKLASLGCSGPYDVEG
jgi:hypothetical protein